MCGGGGLRGRKQLLQSRWERPGIPDQVCNPKGSHGSYTLKESRSNEIL